MAGEERWRGMVVSMVRGGCQSDGARRAMDYAEGSEQRAREKKDDGLARKETGHGTSRRRDGDGDTASWLRRLVAVAAWQPQITNTSQHLVAVDDVYNDGAVQVATGLLLKAPAEPVHFAVTARSLASSFQVISLDVQARLLG